MAKTGYAAPHTVHCGPDGIYINAFGAPGGDGPGGIFMLDHETFELKGRWEKDRGSQYLSYDFWWHLGHDVMITSGPMEGTNNKIKTMKRQAYGFRDRDFFKLKILAIHETRYELVG